MTTLNVSGAFRYAFSVIVFEIAVCLDIPSLYVLLESVNKSLVRIRQLLTKIQRIKVSPHFFQLCSNL